MNEELVIDGVKLRLNKISYELKSVSISIENIDLHKKFDGEFDLGQASNVAALREYLGHISRISHDLNYLTSILQETYQDYNTRNLK